MINLKQALKWMLNNCNVLSAPEYNAPVVSSARLAHTHDQKCMEAGKLWLLMRQRSAQVMPTRWGSIGTKLCHRYNLGCGTMVSTNADVGSHFSSQSACSIRPCIELRLY